MLTETELKKELKDYINSIPINEELSSEDFREIRRLIRVEIAEIFFDLFKKRGVWI